MGAITVCCWSKQFFSWLFTPNDEITSEILIINKCELDTKYFIVRDLDTGNYASFNSGVAKLKTNMNSPLQLQLSTAVKYIYFEGNAVAAKQSLTMIANCSERNLETIKRLRVLRLVWEISGSLEIVPTLLLILETAYCADCLENLGKCTRSDPPQGSFQSWEGLFDR